MNLSKEQLLELYEYIHYARCMGDRLEYFIKSGKILGAIHLPKGQEGLQAGLIMTWADAKRNGIKVTTNPHTRDQPLISKIIGLQDYADEMLCKKTGVNGGTSGEYHMNDFERGMLPAQGVLGPVVGQNVGYAWALKDKGINNEVVWAIFGDGLSSRGDVFEAMNIAALFKTPIVFVITNNGWAMANPVDKESPVQDLSLRAQGCGMRGVTVDGNDPVAVFETMKEANRLAMAGEPNVVEFKVTRWGGHFLGDNQEVYRDMSFLKDLDSIDPVLNFHKTLLAQGVVTEEDFQRVHDEQDAAILNAYEEGLKKEGPSYESITDPNKVYGGAY